MKNFFKSIWAFILSLFGKKPLSKKEMKKKRKKRNKFIKACRRKWVKFLRTISGIRSLKIEPEVCPA